MSESTSANNWVFGLTSTSTVLFLPLVTSSAAAIRVPESISAGCFSTMATSMSSASPFRRFSSFSLPSAVSRPRASLPASQVSTPSFGSGCLRLTPLPPHHRCLLQGVGEACGEAHPALCALCQRDWVD